MQLYSNYVPTQAQCIVRMASSSAFGLASSHDYLSFRHHNDDDGDAPLPFIFSDGGETCFDADVVRLVAQILHDCSDASQHVPLGWDVILAQLQNCHLTSSGTFWSSAVSASAAQAMSPICR